MAHPVLQAAEIAGAVMGWIHPVEVVGMAVETAAEVGSEATSYFRTRAYLKRANEGVFNPRGLQVRIMGFEEMVSVVGGCLEDVKRRGESGLEGGWEGSDDADADVGRLERVVSEARYAQGKGRSSRLLLLEALEGRVALLETEGLRSLSGDRNRLKRWNASFAAREGEKQNERLERRYREAKEQQAERYQEAIDIAREKYTEIGKLEARIEKARAGSQGEKSIADLMGQVAKMRRNKAKRMRERIRRGNAELQTLQRKEIEKTMRVKWLVVSS
ncbi:hypothetical protein BDW62DRAFT_200166 [Aspergillus aurantiobrunneus]